MDGAGWSWMELDGAVQLLQLNAWIELLKMNLLVTFMTR